MYRYKMASAQADHHRFICTSGVPDAYFWEGHADYRGRVYGCVAVQECIQAGAERSTWQNGAFGYLHRGHRPTSRGAGPTHDQ